MVKKVNTRNKIINSAKKLIEEQGARAATIDAVIHDSKAPRGSIYYYFKNGRSQIIEEAVKLADQEMTTMIKNAYTDKKGAITGTKKFFAAWSNYLLKNDLKGGCAVTALIVEGQSIDDHLQQIAKQTFKNWQDLITNQLISTGIQKAQAVSLASLILASGEGAVLLVRSQQTVAPMQNVANEICQLLTAGD